MSDERKPRLGRAFCDALGSSSASAQIRPHQNVKALPVITLILTELLSQALEVQSITSANFDLLHSDLTFILEKLNQSELEMVIRRMTTPKN